MRAPDAPSGWPMAIAPPRTLTSSGSRSGQPARQASDWEANASFSSTTDDVAPADAGARERPVRGLDRGDPEDVGVDAVGGARDDAGQRLAAERGPACSSPISVIAAPSLSGEEFPAVTVPPSRKAGAAGELLERGVGADPLVALELDPGHGHDLGSGPLLVGLRGEPVAAQRERILLLA